MSGMRSEAGLRRTAERFDIWNPASGTLEQHLEIRERLQAMRPADRPPLQVYWNLFVQPPVQVANLRSLTVDELAEMVAAARAAGLEGVMVDANFWSEIERPEDWARVPDLLAPLVERGRVVAGTVGPAIGRPRVASAWSPWTSTARCSPRPRSSRPGCAPRSAARPRPAGTWSS